jgi:plasmid stability protein
MASITVKNIPEDLYERLKRTARLHHRSVNREIIACIERSLRSERVPVDEILAGSRHVREAVGRTLSLREIDDARRAGRP